MTNKKQALPPICKCLECGRSSHAGNQCAFEEVEKMAHCHTFFHMSKIKSRPVKK